MARITDETKIERIRESAMQMVVLRGYGGASILEIARKAGVAEGYLYRFYKSKSELVDDLLYSTLNEIIEKLEGLMKEEELSVYSIFRQLIDVLFDWANFQADKIKFLFVLMHDYNFEIRESQRDRIYDLCRRVKEKGIQSGKIREEIDEEEILLLAVSYPIQFINLRLKNFFHRTDLGMDEKEKVLRSCINSLK
jgi:AcrR family transcriptional regulator